MKRCQNIVCGRIYEKVSLIFCKIRYHVKRCKNVLLAKICEEVSGCYVSQDTM